MSAANPITGWHAAPISDALVADYGIALVAVVQATRQVRADLEFGLVFRGQTHAYTAAACACTKAALELSRGGQAVLADWWQQLAVQIQRDLIIPLTHTLN